jgi:hypothetical protein
MLPQAPTSDTTGWFARDAATFARVSSVLLQEEIPTTLPTRLVIAVDAFGFADPTVATALQPMVERLAKLIGSSREDLMAPQGLSVWARAQRTLQPVEAYNTFKDWLDERNPRFAFSVARGLVMGSMVPESERGWANLMRQEARAAWRGFCRRAQSFACRPHHSRRRSAGSACPCSTRCAIASPAFAPRAGWRGIRKSIYRVRRLMGCPWAFQSSARAAAMRHLLQWPKRWRRKHEQRPHPQYSRGC